MTTAFSNLKQLLNPHFQEFIFQTILVLRILQLSDLIIQITNAMERVFFTFNLLL